MSKFLKTLVAVTLVLPFLIVISGILGCQSQPQQENVGADQMKPLERRIGVLKSLGGVRTSNNGTNLLQLDDGSTILLKSLAVNLDDEAYLDKTVEVRGIITYTTDGKQIMEVMNIDLVDAGTSQEALKAQLKDYSNSSLGVSIRYSSILEVSQEEGGVSFKRTVEFPPSATQTIQSQSLEPGSPVKTAVESGATQEGTAIHKFTISAVKKTAGVTLASILGLSSTSEAALVSKGIQKSRIGAENYDALKSSEGNLIYYYVDATDRIYTITIDCGQDEQSLGDQNLFYEMLGTLRIESAQTATESAGQTEEDADLVNNETAGAAETAGANDTSGTAETNSAEPEDSPETEAAEDSAHGEDAATSETATQSQSQEDAQTAEKLPTVKGYAEMQSDSLGFGMQYPKNWYYAGSGGTGAGVISHYEFGGKPIDEAPGVVSVDIMGSSTTMPSGEPLPFDRMPMTKVTSDGTVTYYAQGPSKRIYCVSGPEAADSTLYQMATSIFEK